METAEIVRCKDCKHRPVDKRDENRRGGYYIQFPDCRCPCQCDDGFYAWFPEDDWFCGNGEKACKDATETLP